MANITLSWAPEIQPNSQLTPSVSSSSISMFETFNTHQH
jgi:hypothetical protein